MEQTVQDAPDQQVSLTNPDARSMATSGKGTATVGYNVQIAVDAEQHLIVAHEVTNQGGTVNLALAACANASRWVVGWDDERRSRPLCRLPVPRRDYQPRRLAVFSVPAWAAYGRGVAGRPRHHRQPRNGAAVGAQIWPAVR